MKSHTRAAHEIFVDTLLAKGMTVSKSCDHKKGNQKMASGHRGKSGQVHDGRDILGIHGEISGQGPVTVMVISFLVCRGEAW